MYFLRRLSCGERVGVLAFFAAFQPIPNLEAQNVLPRLRVMLSGDLMDAEGIYQRSKNVAERPDEIDLDSFSFALVAVSVHAGAHEREMIRFIKKHRDRA